MGQIEKGTKKKSFFRSLLIFFIDIFVIIALIATILCAVSPYISPNHIVWTSFFGLLFWPIFLTDVFLLLIFLILKARKSLFMCLLTIIIAVPGFMRSYSVEKERVEYGNIKVMSYNLANFNDITNVRRTKSLVEYDIIKLIDNEKPDIVCFQESGGWAEGKAVEFGEKIGCKYHCVNKYSHRGNIIFSRFPLEDDDYTEIFNASGAAGFVKLVNAGSRGRFYLQNAHLQSYSITKEEIEYLGDTKNFVENSSKGKSVVMKLKDGFETRTFDTKTIVSNLPTNDIPLIICGDFNDTPMSYTYQQLKRSGFKDAFLEVGHGIGMTYCGKLPLLRIDYFWHGKGIKAYTFNVVKKKMSDHYPIVVTFNVSN